MKDRKVSSFEQTLYETILVMTVIDVIMCPKNSDPEIAPKKYKVYKKQARKPQSYASPKLQLTY